MPIVEFITNIPADKVPEGFADRAASFTAEQLGTPPQAAVVMVQHRSMFRCGSDNPCLVIKLACVDAFYDHDTNRTYSKAFIDFAAAEFNVAAERITLLMENQSMWEIGIPDGRLLGDRMKHLKK